MYYIYSEKLVINMLLLLLKNTITHIGVPTPTLAIDGGYGGGDDRVIRTLTRIACQYK